MVGRASDVLTDDGRESRRRDFKVWVAGAVVAASAAAAGIAAAQLAVLLGPTVQPAADDEPGAAPAQVAPR